MAYGSAISLSVSLMIRFGNAAIVIDFSYISLRRVVEGFGVSLRVPCIGRRWRGSGVAGRVGVGGGCGKKAVGY